MNSYSLIFALYSIFEIQFVFSKGIYDNVKKKGGAGLTV